MLGETKRTRTRTHSTPAVTRVRVYVLLKQLGRAGGLGETVRSGEGEYGNRPRYNARLSSLEDIIPGPWNRE